MKTINEILDLTLSDSCGAGSAGGKGFSKGNSCAGGGGGGKSSGGDSKPSASGKTSGGGSEKELKKKQFEQDSEAPTFEGDIPEDIIQELETTGSVDAARNVLANTDMGVDEIEAMDDEQLLTTAQSVINRGRARAPQFTGYTESGDLPAIDPSGPKRKIVPPKDAFDPERAVEQFKQHAADDDVDEKGRPIAKGTGGAEFPTESERGIPTNPGPANPSETFNPSEQSQSVPATVEAQLRGIARQPKDEPQDGPPSPADFDNQADFQRARIEYTAAQGENAYAKSMQNLEATARDDGNFGEDDEQQVAQSLTGNDAVQHRKKQLEGNISILEAEAKRRGLDTSGEQAGASPHSGGGGDAPNAANPPGGGTPPANTSTDKLTIRGEKVQDWQTRPHDIDENSPAWKKSENKKLEAGTHYRDKYTGAMMPFGEDTPNMEERQETERERFADRVAKSRGTIEREREQDAANNAHLKGAPGSDDERRQLLEGMEKYGGRVLNPTPDSASGEDGQPINTEGPLGAAQAKRDALNGQAPVNGQGPLGVARGRASQAGGGTPLPPGEGNRDVRQARADKVREAFNRQQADNEPTLQDKVADVVNRIASRSPTLPGRYGQYGVAGSLGHALRSRDTGGKPKPAKPPKEKKLTAKERAHQDQINSISQGTDSAQENIREIMQELERQGMGNQVTEEEIVQMLMEDQ